MTFSYMRAHSHTYTWIDMGARTQWFIECTERDHTQPGRHELEHCV